MILNKENKFLVCKPTSFNGFTVPESKHEKKLTTPVLVMHLKNFVNRNKQLKELEDKENQTYRHIARFNESISQRKMPKLRT